MTAVTVLKVHQGWDGDRKRHLAAILLTSGYTVTPEQVGLHYIEDFQPSGINLGTVVIEGSTVALTNCGVIHGTWTTTNVTLTSTGDGNVLIAFYGW